MASEILGLFTSPEMYRRQQDLMMQKQAAELAQLDPYQNVRFSAIRAGQQFGTGLAGLLGAEDPQLRMISARQSVLGGLDLGNPDSILTAARQLANAGDQQGALALADYARKAQADAALVAQRQREGRAAAVPQAVQIAEARARLQSDIKALKAAPASPERDAKLEQAEFTLAGLPIKAEGLVREQQIARDFALASGEEGSEAYKKAYIDKLGKLTSNETQSKLGEFERVMNARYPDTPENAAVRNKLMDDFLRSEIQGRTTKGTTKIENILPGQSKEGAKDVPAFRDKVINTIDPFRKTVTAADSAITNISDSIKTSNFASFRAAQTQFARAISGAGDLSQKELKAAGADPSLIGGTADYLSTFFTSTPTKDTQQKLLSTLKAIRTVAAKKAKDEISNQKKIATRAGYTQDDTDLIFNFPEFEQRGGGGGGGGGKTTTRTLKSGKTYTVTED
jgi:hypothetical protein